MKVSFVHRSCLLATAKVFLLTQLCIFYVLGLLILKGSTTSWLQLLKIDWSICRQVIGQFVGRWLVNDTWSDSKRAECPGRSGWVSSILSGWVTWPIYERQSMENSSSNSVSWQQQSDKACAIFSHFYIVVFTNWYNYIAFHDNWESVFCLEFNLEELQSYSN